MTPRIIARQEHVVRHASLQEILITADGRVLIHNLTPALAAMLRELNQEDAAMRRRAPNSEGKCSDELCAGT